MTTNTAESTESTESRDLEHLACAAPFVFLLVAAADGSIDNKELKRFGQLLGEDDYRILAAVMAQSGLPMEQLLSACQQRLQDPVNELMNLAQVIDARLPGDTGVQFKTALLKLGHAIAQASGGFFGFGKKMDKQEAAMLALIVAAFSNSDGSGSSLQVPETPGEVLSDELFPALKPADWVASARDHVVMQGIYLTDEIKDNEPVVGYVHDKPQTVTFVPADTLSDQLSVAQVHEHAMTNLEQRLAELEWQDLSFDANVNGLGSVKGLVLAGDYFASEAILSETALKRAHQKLNGAMLMAIVPQRGELFVTDLVSQEQPEPEPIMFAQFAIKRYFNAEQAPISPNVFIIRNGKLVGTVGGMEAIIEGAREMGESERAEEDALLEHEARMHGTNEAAALQISVKAHCVETMLKNLQHVIRDYVRTVMKNDSFNGNVTVTVALHDAAYADKHDTVGADLDNLAQFLTDQFASMGFKGCQGSPLAVRCELEASAAA